MRVVMKEALDITDKTFQTECMHTISKWVLTKQEDIINNTKSPYRTELKKCKWVVVTR